MNQAPERRKNLLHHHLGSCEDWPAYFRRLPSVEKETLNWFYAIATETIDSWETALNTCAPYSCSVHIVAFLSSYILFTHSNLKCRPWNEKKILKT